MNKRKPTHINNRSKDHEEECCEGNCRKKACFKDIYGIKVVVKDSDGKIKEKRGGKRDE